MRTRTRTRVACCSILLATAASAACKPTSSALPDGALNAHDGRAGDGGAGQDGGSSGDAHAGACSASTPLSGCTQFSTVGALEAGLFAIDTMGAAGNQPPTWVPGCSGVQCHSVGMKVPDLQSAHAYTRLVDVEQLNDGQFPLCTPAVKYIDTSHPANSLLLAAVHAPAFTNVNCPSTSQIAGQAMPRNLPALGAAELACVDAYVTALVGCH